jgi:hypothetical protein
MQTSVRLLPIIRKAVFRHQGVFRLARGFANLDSGDLNQVKEQYKQHYKELYTQAKLLAGEKGSPQENFEDILNDVRPVVIQFDKLVKASDRLQEITKVLSQELREMQMEVANLPRLQAIAEKLEFEELVQLGIKFFTGSMGKTGWLSSQPEKRYPRELLFLSCW